MNRRNERGVDIISYTFSGLFILVILVLAYAFYATNQAKLEQTIVYEEMIAKGYSPIDIYRLAIEYKNRALIDVSYSKMSRSTILEELTPPCLHSAFPLIPHYR